MSSAEYVMWTTMLAKEKLCTALTHAYTAHEMNDKRHDHDGRMVICKELSSMGAKFNEERTKWKAKFSDNWYAWQKFHFRFKDVEDVVVAIVVVFRVALVFHWWCSSEKCMALMFLDYYIRRMQNWSLLCTLLNKYISFFFFFISVQFVCSGLLAGNSNFSKKHKFDEKRMKKKS